MAVSNALKFFKGWYGKGENRHLPNEPKAIIFNEEEGVVYVNGKSYGGTTDVNFQNGVLTITYTDGRPATTLDFNDTASASATLKVFERIENLIGENVCLPNSDGKLNYKGTKYLEDAETLVEADRILDEVVFGTDVRIDNLNSELYSGGSEDEPVIVSVKQEGGLLTNVDVMTLGANISFDQNTKTLSVENQNGMVFGTDVLSIKDYIDSKSQSSVEVVNTNGDNDALVVDSFVDNGVKKYDVNLVWSEWGSENE